MARLRASHRHHDVRRQAVFAPRPLAASRPRRVVIERSPRRNTASLASGVPFAAYGRRSGAGSPFGLPEAGLHGTHCDLPRLRGRWSAYWKPKNTGLMRHPERYVTGTKLPPWRPRWDPHESFAGGGVIRGRSAGGNVSQPRWGRVVLHRRGGLLQTVCRPSPSVLDAPHQRGHAIQ